MPCAAGATPTVSDVKAVAVVLGTTEVIGPPAMRRQLGRQMTAFLQLQPPQTIDHQQDHLRGDLNGLGEPLGAVPGGSQQTRDHAGQVGAFILAAAPAGKKSSCDHPRGRM